MNVGAARKERDVEQRGQKHSEERADPEEAPLIGATPLATIRASAPSIGIAGEHETGVCDMPLLAGGRCWNVAGALAHAVAAIAGPVRQHDVHDTART